MGRDRSSSTEPHMAPLFKALMMERRECSRGCGLMSLPGPIGKHEKTCWTPPTLERLYEIGSIDTSVDGCWEWVSLEGGAHNWYPRVRQTKVMNLVCRLVYGERPSEAHQSLHSCDNKRCVRADHLRWGTQAENVQDMVDRNRGAWVERRKRTHCKRGHPYDEANTYMSSKGRTCRTCRREAEQRKKAGTR